MSLFAGSVPGSLGAPAEIAGAPLSALEPIPADAPDWVAEIAAQLERSGEAAEIYDAAWRLRWVSPELKTFLGDPTDEQLGIGEHNFRVHRRPLWSDRVSRESGLHASRITAPYVLADTPEPVEELTKGLEPEYAQLIQQAEPTPPPPLWTVELDFLHEELPAARVSCIHIRLHDGGGTFLGTLRLYGPGMRASVVNLIARGDEGLLERIGRLITPGRHGVAILFADLEGSMALARRLPSAVYFELAAALAQETDEIITRHSGVVGKHTGDGVSAFFIADPHDHAHSSAAARAALKAAFEIRELARGLGPRIAEQAGIGELDLRLNVGLHWGASVYIGQISTAGRLEVTALGDEPNEAARLQQAARGGEILASKTLLEQLDAEDAAALGLDTKGLLYELVAEREGLSRKVARDVGNLPVSSL